MPTDSWKQLVRRPTGDEVGAVAAAEVLDAVDPLLVPLQGEVGRALTDRPHLDRAIQRSRRECVGVLGVAVQVKSFEKANFETGFSVDRCKG